MRTQTQLRTELQAVEPQFRDIDLNAVRRRARRIRARRHAAYALTTAAVVAAVAGAVTLTGGGSGRPANAPTKVDPPPTRISVEGYTVTAWAGSEGTAEPIPNDPSIVFDPGKRHYVILKNFVPRSPLPGGKQILVTPRVVAGPPAVMDIASRKIVRRMPGDGQISPNGREFLTGQPGHFKVTDIATGKSHAVSIPRTVEGQQVENVLWYYDNQKFTVQLKPGNGHSHRNALVDATGAVQKIFPFDQVIDSSLDWSPRGRYVIAHDRQITHDTKSGEQYVTGGPIFIIDAHSGAKLARIQKELSFFPDGVWWVDDQTFLLDRRLGENRPMPDPVQLDLIGLDGKVQRTETLPTVGKNGFDEGQYTMLLSR